MSLDKAIDSVKDEIDAALEGEVDRELVATILRLASPHFAEVMAQRLEAEANTYLNQRDVDTVLECAAFLRESDR